MTGWESWSNGNRAKNLNLTIQTNGIRKIRICSGKWDSQNSLGFWDTSGSSNSGQTTKPYNNQQKKREPAK